MLTSPAQKCSLFTEVVTRCFWVHGCVFLLGVSSPASSAGTPLTNTERTFVLGCPVEPCNIPLRGMTAGYGLCLYWGKLLDPLPFPQLPVIGQRLMTTAS